MWKAWVLVLAAVGISLYLIFARSSQELTISPLQRSSFNGLELRDRQEKPLSFAVCGHVYGHPGAGFPHPAPTIVENRGRIRASGADFLMLLGDSFFSWELPEVEGLVGFSKELGIPVFNAVGNHEMARREDYVKRFGPTWFAFDHGSCRMVVLDTEIDSWHVSGDQLDFLHEEIDRALDPSSGTEALFVFCHKPIWASTRRTAIASLRSNTPTTLSVFATRPMDAPTFNRDIRPGLRRLAGRIPVWCFAGDVGAFEDQTIHLFHETDELAPELHYAAVGLGNLARDAFILVTLPTEGPPGAKGIELKTGRELDLADYDSAFWMNRFFPEGLPELALPFIENGGR